jgi:hypothetical protein
MFSPQEGSRSSFRNVVFLKAFELTDEGKCPRLLLSLILEIRLVVLKIKQAEGQIWTTSSLCFHFMHFMQETLTNTASFSCRCSLCALAGLMRY